MKSILVPIDFSEITSDVVEMAAGLARTYSASLVILHAAAPELAVRIVCR